MSCFLGFDDGAAYVYSAGFHRRVAFDGGRCCYPSGLPRSRHPLAAIISTGFHRGCFRINIAAQSACAFTIKSAHACNTGPCWCKS